MPGRGEGRAEGREVMKPRRPDAVKVRVNRWLWDVSVARRGVEEGKGKSAWSRIWKLLIEMA